MKNPFLEAGKIVNTHGIAGEVKVVHWCDSPEYLLGFDTLYLDGAPVKVRSARVHKQNVLLHLEGVEDINAAMRLKDKILSIRRDDAPLPEGQHFLADLYGITVQDAQSGEVLGTIQDILTPPAHPIYVVQGGVREYMIPAVPAFIKNVDMEAGVMTVSLIEGM